MAQKSPEITAKSENIPNMLKVLFSSQGSENSSCSNLTKTVYLVSREETRFRLIKNRKVSLKIEIF